MDGRRLSSDQAHERRIRAWMNAIVADGGIDRYDDLHVDQIDLDWKKQETWIAASLGALSIAVGVRNEMVRNLIVVLAFSLKSDERPTGINFHSAEEFQRELDVTPPSLYLLRQRMEFWTQPAEQATIKTLDPRTLLGADSAVKGCVYMEFRPGSSEDYTRSLFLFG